MTRHENKEHGNNILDMMRDHDFKNRYKNGREYTFFSDRQNIENTSEVG